MGTPEPPTVNPTPAPTYRDLSSCTFEYVEGLTCPAGQEIVSAGECVQATEYEWLGEKAQKTQMAGCVLQWKSETLMWNEASPENQPKSDNFKRLCAVCR